MASRPKQPRKTLEHPVLRDDQGERSVALKALLEELTQGRVSANGLVRYSPWTGNHFVPIMQLPQLQETLDAPKAKAARHFKTAPSYLGAGLLMGVLVLLGVLQLRLLPTSPSVLALSWENVYLSDRPWAVLSGHFFHADLRHLMVNAILLSYCAFRVERVYGMGRTIQMLLATILASALLWLSLGLAPVIGASMMMYTMWVAQIAIGFRYGSQLPRPMLRYYGWGTAVIFIPIVVLTLYEPRSSQIGHALGAAVGAVAVVLYSPLWMRNKLSTYSWGAFVLPLGVLGWLIQQPLSLQQQQDLLEEVTINVPAFSESTERGWKVGSEIEIVHSELWLASAEELTAELLQQRWLSEHQLKLQLVGQELVAEHLQPGEGSVPIHRWQWRSEDWEVEERSVRHGELVRRISCRAPLHSMALMHCRRWLQTVKWSDPSELRALRKRWGSNAQNVRTGQALQNYLAQVGWVNEADTVLASLSRRIDPHRWEAYHERVRLRLNHPQLIRWSDDRHWVQQLIESYPLGQEALVLDALTLIDRQADCPLVRYGIERMVYLSNATARVLEERLERCVTEQTGLVPL